MAEFDRKMRETEEEMGIHDDEEYASGKEEDGDDHEQEDFIEDEASN